MPTRWTNDRLAKALEPREYFFNDEWVSSLISAAKDLNLRKPGRTFHGFRCRLGFLLHYIMARHDAASCADFDGQDGLFNMLLTLQTITFKEWAQTMPARHAVKPQRH